MGASIRICNLSRVCALKTEKQMSGQRGAIRTFCWWQGVILRQPRGCLRFALRKLFLEESVLGRHNHKHGKNYEESYVTHQEGIILH